MDTMLYYLNERDRRNTQGGYFIMLAPVDEEAEKRIFNHHLNELLINENLTNAARLIDTTIQNLPESITGDYEEKDKELLITNIERRENLNNVSIVNNEKNKRTLYFLET